MALNYVTLILDAYDVTGAYLTGGAAVIAPNSILVDPTDAEWVPPAQVTTPFSIFAATPSVRLLATDNANITPSGWAYTIQFLGVAGNPAGFSFFLPHSNGATQHLSAIVPAIASPPALFSYLPLPSGTPQAGQAPIATGAGETTAWGAASAAAGDASIAVSGGLITTGTLDQIAALHPAAGAVTLNSKKVTNLATGTASGDGVNVGQLAAYAPLNSPTFTGAPLAPTQTVTDNGTAVATDQFVWKAIRAAYGTTAGLSGPNQSAGTDGNLYAPRTDRVDVDVPGSLGVGVTLNGPIVYRGMQLRRIWLTVGSLSFGGSVQVDFMMGAQTAFPTFAPPTITSPGIIEVTVGSLPGTPGIAVLADSPCRVNILAISGTATDLQVSAWFVTLPPAGS